MRNRPLGDLLVLIVVGTVCAAILLAAGGLAIAKIIDPNADNDSSFAALAGVLSSLTAFIGGYFAGKTEKRRRNGNGNGHE